MDNAVNNADNFLLATTYLAAFFSVLSWGIFFFLRYKYRHLFKK